MLCMLLILIISIGDIFLVADMKSTTSPLKLVLYFSKISDVDFVPAVVSMQIYLGALYIFYQKQYCHLLARNWQYLLLVYLVIEVKKSNIPSVESLPSFSLDKSFPSSLLIYSNSCVDDFLSAFVKVSNNTSVFSCVMLLDIVNSLCCCRKNRGF